MGIPTTPGSSPFKQNSPATPTATAPSAGTPLPGMGGNGSDGGKIRLQVSLEGVQESKRLEPGRHVAVVERVEEIQSRTTRVQGIKFHLRFMNFPGVEEKNPNDGRTSYHSVYVTPKAMWKVKNTFCAVGQCDAIDAFDGDAATGVLVLVDVTEDEYLPEGKEDIPSNRVKTARCDTLIEWPDHLGGAGTRLQR